MDDAQAAETAKIGGRILNIWCRSDPDCAVSRPIRSKHEAQLRNHEDIERVHIAHTIEELVNRSAIQQALADSA